MYNFFVLWHFSMLGVLHRYLRYSHPTQGRLSSEGNCACFLSYFSLGNKQQNNCYGLHYNNIDFMQKKTFVHKELKPEFEVANWHLFMWWTWDTSYEFCYILQFIHFFPLCNVQTHIKSCCSLTLQKPDLHDCITAQFIMGGETSIWFLKIFKIAYIRWKISDDGCVAALYWVLSQRDNILQYIKVILFQHSTLKET